MSDLEQRMKDVLAEAAVIAEAGASKLDSSKISSGKSGTKEPTMSGTPIYDKIRDRFERARTDAERSRAVAWAEGLVRKAKRQAPREESTTERDFWRKRQVLDGSGTHYEDLAFNLKLDPKFIWKVRVMNDLEPRYGNPKSGTRAA